MVLVDTLWTVPSPALSLPSNRIGLGSTDELWSISTFSNSSVNAFYMQPYTSAEEIFHCLVG